jgi:hypothetical protein
MMAKVFAKMKYHVNIHWTQIKNKARKFWVFPIVLHEVFLEK